MATTTTVHHLEQPRRKPLPPSKPDYVIKSPTLLPPPYPKPPKQRTEAKSER